MKLTVSVPAVLLVSLATLLIPLPTHGVDTKFPAGVEVGGTKLTLNGEGLCEWGVFGVDIYRAALYLEKRSSKPKEILDSQQAKRVELRFSRKLSRKQMVKAYRVSLEANAGAKLPEYQKGLDQLVGVLTAMRVNDRLTFDYHPKTGLKVLINDKLKTTIPGTKFGTMLFRLYVGAKPPTEALKKGLLGRSR